MLRFAIVVVAVLIGGTAALRSRFGGLLFYIWFAIFRPEEWSWVDISAYRPSLIVGLLFVIPCLLTGVFPVVTHPLSIGALLFLGCGLLAQTNAVAPDLGWYFLGNLGRLILICLLLTRLTNTKDRFYKLILTIAASFAFFSAKAGLDSLASGGVHFLEGLSGAFSDSNAYAVGCVMVMPLLIAVCQTTSSRAVRWLAAAAVPLTAFTVVSTYSRGGFLAMAATAVVWILFQPRRLLIGAVTVALAVIALLVVPIPKGYADRLETIQTYDQVQETSALSRLHVWTVALHVAADRPLGTGLWGFESIYDEYDFSNGAFGHARAIHNSHLQALVEAGWAGGVVWVTQNLLALWIGVTVVRRSKRLSEADAYFYRTMGIAVIVSLCGFLVGGSFVSMAYTDMTWLLFAALAALDRMSKAAEAELPSDFSPTILNSVAMRVPA